MAKITYKYLEVTFTSPNCIQEYVKSRLNSENVSYQSAQSVLQT
jgi:hypothetical protein